MLIDYNIALQDIHNETDLAWGTIAKIKKGEPTNLLSLIKICAYLTKVSDKTIKIDDIIDYDYDE